MMSLMWESEDSSSSPKKGVKPTEVGGGDIMRGDMIELDGLSERE